jgi:hypothetical protein
MSHHMEVLRVLACACCVGEPAALRQGSGAGRSRWHACRGRSPYGGAVCIAAWPAALSGAAGTLTPQGQHSIRKSAGRRDCIRLHHMVLRCTGTSMVWAGAAAGAAGCCRPGGVECAVAGQQPCGRGPAVRHRAQLCEQDGARALLRHGLIQHAGGCPFYIICDMCHMQPWHVTRCWIVEQSTSAAQRCHTIDACANQKLCCRLPW